MSATFIGAALGADEVTIWTDVDGVYSADPRVVGNARVIRQLNFREAAELSYYGAKVLQQRTMIPVSARGIPILARNSLNPDAPGTRVDGRFTPGSHPVKGLSAVRQHALISIEGKGMAGVPGVAARAFQALAEREISVTMVSQSSSESSICLAVPGADTHATESALKRAFRGELSRGTIEEVNARRGVGLIAVVGLGMARTPGVASRVFGALARAQVNVLAIAQGSSELNISLAVDEEAVDGAIRAIHAEFGLHRIDTGVDSANGLDILLLGCGKVGRALVEMVLERHAHLFERFGLEARIVSIADRSGFVYGPAGIPLDELSGILEKKAAGTRVATLPHGVATSSPTEMVRQLLEYRLDRPVLVDVSDSDDALEAFLEAFERGCDVVTANKKPLAGPLDGYRALMARSQRSHHVLRAEATVGAGLPVVETLEMLMATGDTLVRAEGCLSGTLGFVMDGLERGGRYSEVVEEAMRLGYTEPDPTVDLSGGDVARKATILGRLSGLVETDLQAVPVGLVDASLAGAPLEELFAALRELDDEMSERVHRASDAGAVLRYVARVERGAMQVGPEEVPKDSPLGMLKGTDNMIVVHSERYDTRPLVVSGPGAGIDVTAMGVLGDILRVAAERR